MERLLFCATQAALMIQKRVGVSITQLGSSRSSAAEHQGPCPCSRLTPGHRLPWASPPPRLHLHRPPPETLQPSARHQSAPPGKPGAFSSTPAPWAPHPACAPPACGISPLASPGREGPGVSFPRRPCHSCQGRIEPARPISEEPGAPPGASAQAAPDPAGFVMAHVSQDLHSGLAV